MSRLPAYFVLILLLAWYGFFIVEKTDLTTADLGRHIRNGEFVFSALGGSSPEANAPREHASGGQNPEVLYKNFYSYTHPDFPFNNHHWMGGVIFYGVWSYFGFVGLSLFFVLLSFAAFLFFFSVARSYAGFGLASLLSLFLIPLIAERNEVRPEVFSYLFSGIFLWVLSRTLSDNNNLSRFQRDSPERMRDSFGQGRFSKKSLFILPALMILWANLHSYFFAGILTVAAFWVEKLVSRDWERAKALAPILFLVIVAPLLTPYGLATLLIPLEFSQNYGYRLVENQSVRFLDNLGFIQNPNLGFIKAVLAILALSFAAAFLSGWRKISPAFFLLGAVLSAAAWFALRNFTIFGLFALPVVTANIKIFFEGRVNLSSSAAKAVMSFLASAVVLVTLFTHYDKLPFASGRFGLGLAPGVTASAEFFKSRNISGPIFNNYDIGGYLIYNLYPAEKVFVDNRPEAYPAEFFEDVYVPMQEDPEIFKEKAGLYGFKSVFFSHRDATPWGQKFLVDLSQNPAWKPVFADQYAIIFVRSDL